MSNPALRWPWVTDRAAARATALAGLELYGPQPKLVEALGLATLGELALVRGSQVMDTARALGMSESDTSFALQTLGEVLAQRGLALAREQAPVLVERADRPTRPTCPAACVVRSTVVPSHDGGRPASFFVLASAPTPRVSPWGGPTRESFEAEVDGFAIDLEVLPWDTADEGTLIPPGEHVATIEHGAWGACVSARRAPTYERHAGSEHTSLLFDAALGLVGIATVRPRDRRAEVPEGLVALAEGLVASLQG